ncbi:MAG: PEP-CTERM sorting domain-containing protein [Fimbriimonadaceae bacterium]
MKYDASGNAPFALRGLDGELTNVIFSGPTGGGANGFNNPENTGGFAALLNDGRGFWNDSWRFTGLAAGKYELTSYAVHPSWIVTNTSVSVVGADIETQIVTGPMPGNAFELGITHSVHSISVTNGEIRIEINRGQDVAYLNGFQLTYVVPEPASILVLLAGGAFLLRRRSRVW